VHRRRRDLDRGVERFDGRASIRRQWAQLTHAATPPAKVFGGVVVRWRTNSLAAPIESAEVRSNSGTAPDRYQCWFFCLFGIPTAPPIALGALSI
jgi:hypothetical protein